MKKQCVFIEYLCPYCGGRQEEQIDFDYKNRAIEKPIGITADIECVVGDDTEVNCTDCNRAFKLTLETKIVVGTFKDEVMSVLKENNDEIKLMD